MEIESHYRHLLRELDAQRRSGILCDVSVVVEGRVFTAHRNVLLGSSRYFKTLYGGPGAEPVTVTRLDIVTARGFEAILDFMYSARLALTGANVIEVMSAASYLQMTDIVRACHAFIRAALDISLRPKLVDEPSEFEATPGGGSSPWRGRRTSPANSSGDSAIASSHEGGSICSRDDQGPQSHESREGASTPALWPADPPPSSPTDGRLPECAEPHTGEEQQPSRSGRRKNRKNKDTVRYIAPQPESGDSHSGSPLPSTLSVSGWSGSNQGCSVADAAGEDHNGPGGYGDHKEPHEETWRAGVSEKASLQVALSGRSGMLAAHAELLEEEAGLLLEHLPHTGGGSSGDFAVVRKKFRCPCCSFSAMHQCILKRHLRSHTGERPYPCETCGKTFTRREHMKRHTQVHSKDKKYTCKVCSRAFVCAASVGIRHGSRRHGICSDCARPGGLRGELVTPERAAGVRGGMPRDGNEEAALGMLEDEKEGSDSQEMDGETRRESHWAS
ncbi:zinc finger and BTB domain-containing protein 46-like [Paramormyrops kingsleyae]|uniref:Zinc finger and BTB domain-containing protein 46-like n=1 Tax=Paramormyrops kingsleyae TaxID=1676925 RepID=A0A3B3RRN7_9TELE|nr:zinc finger and BTB domain-containing protein 46-like [Paramormyrops kingsleyae]